VSRALRALVRDEVRKVELRLIARQRAELTQVELSQIEPRPVEVEKARLG
jgi:hypothetical protein